MVETATEAAEYGGLQPECQTGVDPPPVAVDGIMTTQMGATPTATVGHILRLLTESEGGVGATHTTKLTVRLTTTIPRLSGGFGVI